MTLTIVEICAVDSMLVRLSIKIPRLLSCHPLSLSILLRAHESEGIVKTSWRREKKKNRDVSFSSSEELS